MPNPTGFNLFSPTGGARSQSPDPLGPNTPAPFQQVPPNGLNFNGMQNAVGIHSQTQSAAQPVALAAVMILSEASGVFDYDIDVSFASNLTGKTVRLRAVLYPGGSFDSGYGKFVQSSGSPSSDNPICGPAYAGPGDPYVVQLSVDATGLSANGLLYEVTNRDPPYAPVTSAVPPIDTAPNAIILWDQEIDTLTGQLSNGDNAFHAHGRTGFTNGVPSAGFGPGNYAMLVLELVSVLDDSGDVITFGPCTMGIAEVG